MKFEYISKTDFDHIKDNLVEWLNRKLEKDADTIFQFSPDLTQEDIKYIYQNANYFHIRKNKILEIDHFEKVDTTDYNENCENNESKSERKSENNECSEVKYEIIMKAGRKYYNKLQRYPIPNMGTINIINNKLDYQMKVISSIFCLNLFMFIYMLNK